MPVRLQACYSMLWQHVSDVYSGHSTRSMTGSLENPQHRIPRAGSQRFSMIGVFAVRLHLVSIWMK